jgi:hypothetical protein
MRFRIWLTNKSKIYHNKITRKFLPLLRLIMTNHPLKADRSQIFWLRDIGIPECS